MQCHYRKAAPADCRTLAELKGIVWNTTYQGIYPAESLANYDVAKNEAIFRSIIANPDIELYTAECEGRLIGLMTCGKPLRPFLHYQQELGLLYVLKEYQRQGVGRGFFALARAQVRQNGCREFFLSVNRRNLHAIRFYLAMGGRILHEDDRQLRIGYVLSDP